jgi:tryptophan synthase alpha subunit
VVVGSAIVETVEQAHAAGEDPAPAVKDFIASLAGAVVDARKGVDA